MSRNWEIRKSPRPGKEPWRITLYGGPLDGHRVQATEYGTKLIREKGYVKVKVVALGDATFLYRTDALGTFVFVETERRK